MVVMQFLDDADGWLPCHKLDNPKEARRSVMDLLERAHAERAEDGR
jgi:hypothetical protein